MKKLSLLLVMGLLLAGCGSDSAGIPSKFQGNWMAAVFDTEENLIGGGMFTVDSQGGIHVNTVGVIASGHVAADGKLTLTGQMPDSTFYGIGTLGDDDTGTGTWVQKEGAIEVGSGTLMFWRANGGAYAGIWDVVISGAAAGAGSVVIDNNGVISGSVETSGSPPITTTVFGVVTGSGEVIVAWESSGQLFFGHGPATGVISGSTASGSWQSAGGLAGEWTATKR